MNIELISVQWKNLLSTGNAFTKVELNTSSSTLIQGKNGAGKSTFLDALVYGLYGVPFRKINKPQLLNSVNDKDLLVEVNFAVGNDEYEVARGIKPKRFEIYKNGFLINQDASIKDQQSFLETSILKMNRRSFCQVVVLGSAGYVPFMQLSAWERRQIIEDLLDLKIFTIMNQLLKDRIPKNKVATNATMYDYELLKEKLNIQLGMIARVNESIDKQIDGVNSRKEETRLLIRDLLNKDETLIESCNTLEKEIGLLGPVQEKITRLQNVKERLVDKIARLEKDVSFYHDNDNCPTCKQGIAHDFKQEAIDTKRTELSTINDRLPELDSSYDALAQQLRQVSDLQSKIQRINTELHTNRIRRESLKSKLKDLDAEFDRLEGERETQADLSLIEDLKTRMVSKEEERECLIRQGIVINAAAVLLKDTGIKAKTIKQYIPLINTLINKYLAALDFFVQFELDENFDEKIKSRFRDEFSYQSFSEGEKLRINLAILFAWRAVAKKRNSASTNLLVMDEVLDSSLDATGTEDFMKMIAELTKETNLFVISHQGDTLADKFETTLTFEKHGNFSVMKKVA